MKYSDYEYTFEGNVHATFLKGASDETVISWLKRIVRTEILCMDLESTTNPYGHHHLSN